MDNRTALCLLASLALTGCASAAQMVERVDVLDGRMHVAVTATPIMAADDPDAERTRRDWLGQLARSNHLCLGRSVVEARTEVVVHRGLFADGRQVHYVVGCEN